jgi:hypothetical protein
MARKATNKAQDRKAFLKLAGKILRNPLTGNASHVISYPDEDERVRINDLDMGEIFTVSLKAMKRSDKVEKIRPVEPQDFQFSWVCCEYDEDLYEELFPEE